MIKRFAQRIVNSIGYPIFWMVYCLVGAIYFGLKIWWLSIPFVGLAVFVVFLLRCYLIRIVNDAIRNIRI